MGNYSDLENSVRVDFFKPSGKWYVAEAVVWPRNHYYDGSILDAFSLALYAHLVKDDSSLRLEDMLAVCLEPFHACPHPLMIAVKQAHSTVSANLTLLDAALRARARKL